MATTATAATLALLLSFLRLRVAHAAVWPATAPAVLTLMVLGPLLARLVAGPCTEP